MENDASLREFQPNKRHILIQSSRPWFSVDLSELWAFRDLLSILALRDIKLRYKQTFLGVTWVILQPLVASLIFAIIFGRIAALPSDGKPYLLFVYSGMLAWNLFSNCLLRAGNSLISDSKLITKVYFPRLMIPMASSLAVLLDFAVAFVVMIGLLLVYHNEAPLTWNILALPVLIFILIVISIGVSLFLSALNVYYRDFMYTLPFVIQIWMYASPVVYSTNMIPARWQFFFFLNPITGIIDGFRWALLGTGTFPWLSMSISVIMSAVCFAVGVYTFQRVEAQFADVV